MVFSTNFDNMLYEYPLKIVEIEDFLYNSDDFLWRHVSKTSQGMIKVKKRLQRDSYDGCIRLSEFNDDDFYTNTSKIPRNLTDSTQITLVFTESELYRQHFEKTHLKLINNMIVLDSQINFFTIEDVRKFYELLLNSKRWLFHGVVKTTNESSSKDLKRKSKFSLYNRNSNPQSQQTDVLLILNSSEGFVRDQLIRNFKRLIKSFSTYKRSVFEIDFEKALSVFYTQKIAKSNIPMHKYEIQKSKITFTSSPSHISALLNNSSQHSFSSFVSFNKPKKIGVFINKFKNVLAQKVQKVSNSSPTIYNKFSFEILPHLLCFLDENKAQVNYISYNDEKFFTIVNNANDLQRRQENLANLDKLLTKKNSSGSDWSWSMNSSMTGYSSSKSFDCLTEKYLSAYETDLEIELEKDRKYLNRSLLDVSQSPENKYQKSLFVKNVNINRSKINKIGNEISSVNSSLSSISNYLNKKKKLSGSSDILSSSESERLLCNDMETSTSDSDKFNKSVSYIKYEESDFRQAINPHKQKLNENKINLKLENSDEMINRHPALVRSALRSKSADLLGDRNNMKTILKAKSKANHQNLIDLDYEEIEETTKKNTFLNSQIFKNQVMASHSSRKDQNSNFLTQQELVGSKSKIYQQNIKTLNDSNDDLDGSRKSKRSSSKTMTYTRCCSKQRPKKSYSPPPPIYISPTGLIAPPPTHSLRKENVENNKENYDNKIKFYEIRNKFERVSRLNSQPMNQQAARVNPRSQMNSITTNVSQNNYNHLNFKISSYL